MGTHYNSSPNVDANICAIHQKLHKLSLFTVRHGLMIAEAIRGQKMYATLGGWFEKRNPILKGAQSWFENVTQTFRWDGVDLYEGSRALTVILR